MAPKRRFAVALSIVLSFTTAPSSLAQTPDRQPNGCWSPPAAETLEELWLLAKTRNEQAVRQNVTRRQSEPAILALSDGGARIAYGAGLIVGWGETGYRPAFAAVLAAGRSALLAPFAFLGDEGDVRISSLFHCHAAASWRDFGERAAALIDSTVIAAIAKRHTNGARLLIAVPGSPIRPETVWDIGAIAASDRPDAIEAIGNLLRAAADPMHDLERVRLPSWAGRIVSRNWIFRKAGSGEPFLSPTPQLAPVRSYFLVHNGVLFADESDEFIAQVGSAESPRTDFSLVTAFDVLTRSKAEKAHFRFSSVRPKLNLVNQGPHDSAYSRGLFHFAYRQGRMGKEWRDGLPTQMAASRQQ
jgi:hypothetical protein